MHDCLTFNLSLNFTFIGLLPFTFFTFPQSVFNKNSKGLSISRHDVRHWVWSEMKADWGEKCASSKGGISLLGVSCSKEGSQILFFKIQ